MNAANYSTLRHLAGGFEELLRAAINADLVSPRLEDGSQHAKEVALLSIDDRDAQRLERTLHRGPRNASSRERRMVRNVVARYLAH